MPHDVFLSYSSKDKPTADAVCALLEREGLRCWIAPRDIKPGEDWPEAIITALDGCEVLVLVFSSHSNESNQCKREVERAFDKGLPVLPLRIEHVEPSKSLEYFISTPHWLDAVNPPLEDHTKKLAFTIRTIIKSPPPMPRKRKRPPIMPLIARPVREDGSKAPWVLSVLAICFVVLFIIGMISLIYWMGSRPNTTQPADIQPIDQPVDQPADQPIEHPIDSTQVVR